MKLTATQKESWVPADYLEVFNLSLEELLKVEYDTQRWPCCVEGCKRGANLKDFGTHPFYLFKKKWVCVDLEILICGKHWPAFKIDRSSLTMKKGNPFYSWSGEDQNPII